VHESAARHAFLAQSSRLDPLDGCVGQLVIRDAKGRPVATSDYCDGDSNVRTPPAISGFRPRAGGTCFVDVEGALCPQCGDVARYAISLEAR
jgi:hypothetical protein